MPWTARTVALTSVFLVALSISVEHALPVLDVNPLVVALDALLTTPGVRELTILLFAALSVVVVQDVHTDRPRTP